MCLLATESKIIKVVVLFIVNKVWNCVFKKQQMSSWLFCSIDHQCAFFSPSWHYLFLSRTRVILNVHGNAIIPCVLPFVNPYVNHTIAHNVSRRRRRRRSVRKYTLDVLLTFNRTNVKLINVLLPSLYVPIYVKVSQIAVLHALN
jgi:hypothetical protein